MNSSAFNLGEQLNNRRVRYYLHQPMWDNFGTIDLDLSFLKWKSIKYLNDFADDFHSDISLVPNDSGGLYMFYIKCPIITGITEFPIYIGRAQHSNHQNLRKRVKEYFSLYSKNDERPKITTMFHYWGKELYLAYYPLSENANIIDLEKKLINSLLLPMNDLIPDLEIKQAIKAFEI